MGNNSDSKVFFTRVVDGAGFITTYYCQKHGVWDQGTDSNIPKDHMTIKHGLIDL